MGVRGLGFRIRCYGSRILSYWLQVSNEGLGWGQGCRAQNFLSGPVMLMTTMMMMKAGNFRNLHTIFVALECRAMTSAPKGPKGSKAPQELHHEEH